MKISALDDDKIALSVNNYPTRDQRVILEEERENCLMPSSTAEVVCEVVVGVLVVGRHNNNCFEDLLWRFVWLKKSNPSW